MNKESRDRLAEIEERYVASAYHRGQNLDDILHLVMQLKAAWEREERMKAALGEIQGPIRLDGTLMRNDWRSVEAHEALSACYPKDEPSK